MQDNSLANEIEAALRSVCLQHGLEFYGLHGFKKDRSLSFRFTVSYDKRSLSEGDKALLSSFGISDDATKIYTSKVNGNEYSIVGINLENAELPIVLKCKKTGAEFFCAPEKLKNMVDED